MLMFKSLHDFLMMLMHIHPISNSFNMYEVLALHELFTVVNVAGIEEYKVLKASYDKLASILPVKSLSHHLVSTGIITVDEEEEIMSITLSREKASFVVRKIARSLEAGVTQSFYTLLTIMKGHGGDVAILADQIMSNFSGLSNHSHLPHSYTC